MLDGDVFGPCLEFLHLNKFFECFFHVEHLQGLLEVVRLNLGEVKQVVYEKQQYVGT